MAVLSNNCDHYWWNVIKNLTFDKLSNWPNYPQKGSLTMIKTSLRTTVVVLRIQSFSCFKSFSNNKKKEIIFTLAWQISIVQWFLKIQQVQFMKYFFLRALGEKESYGKYYFGLLNVKGNSTQHDNLLNSFFKEILCHLWLYWVKRISYTYCTPFYRLLTTDVCGKWNMQCH